MAGRKDTTKKVAKKLYKKIRDHRTLAEKSADWTAKWIGSWTFIAGMTVFLIIWMVLNVYLLFFKAWDPYPFILLNLILSTIASYQAPIILMSQNRQADADRRRFEYDYKVNRLAEREITQIQKDVSYIRRKISKRK